MKKYFTRLTIICFLILSLWTQIVVWASPVSQDAENQWAAIPFCDGTDANGNPECWLQQWIDAVGEIGGLENDIWAADFIQEIVGYILSFVSLIAVIYIIYAGFQILIWNGEEEKLKKSKQTILYVILGIIVIWLAWPITIMVIRALS